jgi:hypothetical protein
MYRKSQGATGKNGKSFYPTHLPMPQEYSQEICLYLYVLGL